jgi:uncharacterized membrane protein YoaK (UPF0700 family)
MVVLLAWAAGSLDAIGYLGLGNVFTANMTGNAVFLGLAIGQGHGLAALRSVVALAGFALGIALGAAIAGRDRERTAWPSAVNHALLAEAVVLLCFTVTWHLPGEIGGGTRLYLLIALASGAMGIQSAAVRYLNVPGVATTYITGTLTSLVSEVIVWVRHAVALVLHRTAAVGSSAVPPAVPWNPHMGLQGAVFTIYVLSAVVSGVVQTRMAWFATDLPILAVGLVWIAGWARVRHAEAAES